MCEGIVPLFGGIHTKQFIGLIFPYIENDDFVKRYQKYTIEDVFIIFIKYIKIDSILYVFFINIC